jgi:hypothetical protein
MPTTPPHLFLLNEVVLNVEGVRIGPKLTSRHLQALSLGDLIQMGQELYAETPLLHLFDKARARRLAALIMTKSPEINGALFLAPAYGCSASSGSNRRCWRTCSGPRRARALTCPEPIAASGAASPPDTAASHRRAVMLTPAP